MHRLRLAQLQLASNKFAYALSIVTFDPTLTGEDRMKRGWQGSGKAGDE